MITIADLNALRANPQVAYDGYGELREAARRRNGGLADPREIPALERLMRERGRDWCSSVLGYPVEGGLRSISSLDADMLAVARERGLDPPLPGWLAQWKAESAETQRLRDQARDQAQQRDRDRWAAAVAACKVSVEVRPNVHGRRYRSVLGGTLRHVVPLADAISGRSRSHQAGRALCETPTRAKPLVLGEPTDEPATCVSCIAYAAKIRPGETNDPPSGIWTITKKHGEEMGRVRAQDHDGAVRAARGIYAVRQYEDAHGGFGLRRLTRSEAGPGADDEDI